MRENRLKVSILVLLITAALAHLTTANAQRFSIFGVTQVWKYATDCHDGDGWETTGFDDSTWLSGPGGFTGGETAAAIVATSRKMRAWGSIRAIESE